MGGEGNVRGEEDEGVGRTDSDCGPDGGGGGGRSNALFVSQPLFKVRDMDGRDLCTYIC